MGPLVRPPRARGLFVSLLLCLEETSTGGLRRGGLMLRIAGHRRVPRGSGRVAGGQV